MRCEHVYLLGLGVHEEGAQERGDPCPHTEEAAEGGSSASSVAMGRAG